MATNPPNEFDAALATLLAATSRPNVITAGELHRAVGGYPGRNHRMPMAVGAMRRRMTAGDQVVHSPPKGVGASFSVRFG